MTAAVAGAIEVCAAWPDGRDGVAVYGCLDGRVVAMFAEVRP